MKNRVDSLDQPDWPTLAMRGIVGLQLQLDALARARAERELDARRRAVVIAALVPVALLSVVALVAWACAS